MLKIFIYLLTVVHFFSCRHRTMESLTLIDRGRKIAKKDYPATIAIVVKKPLEDIYALKCTGVRISKDLFMTAAHCIFSDWTQSVRPHFQNGSKIFIYHGKNFTEDHDRFLIPVTIDFTTVAPSYLNLHSSGMKGSTITQQKESNDLGIFSIRETILPETIPLAKLSDHVLTSGDKIRIGGYGPLQPKENDFELNYELAMVDQIQGNYFTHSSLPSVKLLQGDSGGPVYLSNDNIDPFTEIVGFNSFTHEHQDFYALIPPKNFDLQNWLQEPSASKINIFYNRYLQCDPYNKIKNIKLDNLDHIVLMPQTFDFVLNEKKISFTRDDADPFAQEIPFANTLLGPQFFYLAFSDRNLYKIVVKTEPSYEMILLKNYKEIFRQKCQIKPLK